MTAVLERHPASGSEKLVMVSLANHADETGLCYPSVGRIAQQARISVSQARRVLRHLEREGWLSVVGNASGGAPGSTRRYQLNLPKLEQTPSVHAPPTPSTHARGRTSARGRMDARDGSHPCAETGRIAMTPELSENYQEEKERRARVRAQAPKGTRLAITDLPDEWWTFAVIQRPDIDAVPEFEKFRDHWIAQPGQKGVKADWFATWRNWIRRAYDKRTAPNSGRRKSGAEILAESCASAFEPGD